jgi:transforming growth factor-beta-induced protein
MKKLLTIAALAAALTAMSIPAATAERFKPGDQTIAEIAVSDPGNFSTLVAALSCTDLVGAVAAEDAELTVFAPTNAAFAKLNLDASNVCTIDTGTLSTILLYHVVDERRTSPSVINGMNKSIDMLAGGAVYPDGNGSTVIRDNGGNAVTIVIPDVLASNGVVHVVDTVLLP